MQMQPPLERAGAAAYGDTERLGNRTVGPEGTLDLPDVPFRKVAVFSSTLVLPRPDKSVLPC